MKKIAAVCLMLLCIMIMKDTFYAETGVAAAAENVFGLNVYLEDGNENRYLIRTETCFLIGNMQEGQTQYLITDDSLLMISDDITEAIRVDNNIKPDVELHPAYEVIINENVRIFANISNEAQEDDFAILVPQNSIADRTGIPLGDEKQRESIQEYVAVSYVPESFSTSSQTISLNLNEQNNWVYSCVNPTNMNYGCPVIDEKGYLYGISVYHNDKNKNMKAVSLEKLRKTFDVLGVTYEDGDYSPEKLTPLQIVMLVLAGMILIVVIVLIVLLIKNKNRKNQIVHIGEEHDNKKNSGRKKTEAKKEIDFDSTVAMVTNLSTAFLVNHQTGEKKLISKNHFILGRKKEEVDYVVSEDGTVGRKHAMIVNENGVFYIIDNGSANHTYLNNVELAPHQKQALRNGDKVKLANVELEFLMK